MKQNDNLRKNKNFSKTELFDVKNEMNEMKTLL